MQDGRDHEWGAFVADAVDATARPSRWTPSTCCSRCTRRARRRSRRRCCTPSAGYLTYVAVTHRWIFDIHDDDVYWCAADIGWVTGHSYIVYGPLANGTTERAVRGRPGTARTRTATGQIVERYGVDPVLHGANTDPRLMRDSSPQVPAAHDLMLAAPAGIGRRADQSRGVGVVMEVHRGRALPDRGHVVADRDRWHPDHAASRDRDDEAGLGDAAVPRDPGRGRGRPRRSGGAGQRRLPRITRPWPGMFRTLYRTTSATSPTTSPGSASTSTSRATAPARTPRATSGCSGGSTTS